MIIGLAVTLASPFVIATVRAARFHWHPSWDLAAIMLRSLDVGTSGTPLVGPYSRLGWNHPGPLLFYVLAPFVRLFGSNGLLIGAAFINAASLAGGLVIVARCVGRVSAGAAALVGILLCIGLTPGGLIDPWNPTIAVVPFFAFLLSGWADLHARRRIAAVGSLVFGSFVMQAHVGYAPLVAAVWSAELLVRVAARRRAPQQCRHTWAAGIRHMRLPIGIGLLLWLPAIYEELRSAPGNLSSIVIYFAQQDAPIYGYWNAARTLSLMLSPRLPWITGDDQVASTGLVDQGSVISMVVVVVIIAAAGVLSHRGRDRRLSTLCGFNLIVIAAGWFTLARVTGPPMWYLARWTWAISAFTWMTLVFIGQRAVFHLFAARRARRHQEPTSHQVPRRPRIWLPINAAAAALAAIILAVMAWHVRPPAPARSAVIDELATGAIPRLDKAESYLIRWPDPSNFDPFSVGMLAALHDERYRVHFDRGARIVGRNHVRPSADADYDVEVSGSKESCSSVPPDGWSRIACTPGTGSEAPSRSYNLLLRPSG